MTGLAFGIERALLWSGYRPLTLAETSSGPFARDAAETRYIRLDAGTCNMAFMSSLAAERSIVNFLEHLGLRAWAYDVNLERQSNRCEAVNEHRFVVVPEESVLTTELEWLGFERCGPCWQHVDPDCAIPALGPDFEAEIFPCRGHVLAADATSEFGPAEEHNGFCSKVVPPGATANRSVRGYHFVYTGYPQRAITRRRTITIIDPETPASKATAIVNDTLAIAYGAL